MTKARCALVLALANALVARGASAQPFPLPPIPTTDFALPEPAARDAPTGPELPAHPPSLPPAAAPAPDAGASLARLSSTPDLEALRRSRQHERRYGWETLACDAAAVAVLLVGAAAAMTRPPSLDDTPAPRPPAFAVAAGTIYSIGPVVVHAANHALWQAFASAGLRIALPILGFALGTLAGPAPQGQGGNPSLAQWFGGLAGGVAAVAADASLLGWERWHDAGPTPRAALLGANGSF